MGEEAMQQTGDIQKRFVRDYRKMIAFVELRGWEFIAEIRHRTEYVSWLLPHIIRNNDKAA